MLDERRKSEVPDDHELEELEELIDEANAWLDGPEWEAFEHEDRDSAQGEPRPIGYSIA